MPRVYQSNHAGSLVPPISEKRSDEQSGSLGIRTARIVHVAPIHPREEKSAPITIGPARIIEVQPLPPAYSAQPEQDPTPPAYDGSRGAPPAYSDGVQDWPPPYFQESATTRFINRVRDVADSVVPENMRAGQRNVVSRYSATISAGLCVTGMGLFIAGVVSAPATGGATLALAAAGVACFGAGVGVLAYRALNRESDY